MVIDDVDPVVYAIGDIHGRLDLLERREADIARIHDPAKPGVIVLLGDYVDRGPDSAGVLRRLTTVRTALPRICLAGNHDAAFLDFVRAPTTSRDWLEFGGDATLRSYGIDPRHRARAKDEAGFAGLVGDVVPASHIDFLTALPVTLRIGRYLFVHAGIRPGVPLDDQVEDDLMWIREPFLGIGPGLDLTVIHGHTVTREVNRGPGRIGIDTGAYFSDRLTVLRIAGDDVDEL